MKSLSAKHEYFIHCILFSIIFLFIIVEIMLSFTPPIARNVLIHHLAITKFWMIHGGFYETPWAEYSDYPVLAAIGQYGEAAKQYRKILQIQPNDQRALANLQALEDTIKQQGRN